MNAPWWKRCEILHQLGMSWREMALLCGVRTAELRAAVLNHQEMPWMEALVQVPVPRAPGVEYTPRKKEEWAPEAACRGDSIEMYLPKVGTPIDVNARERCANCCVAQECLDEVLTIVDDSTYRAFTTPRIRRGYRKFFEIQVIQPDETEPEREHAEDGHDT